MIKQFADDLTQKDKTLRQLYGQIYKSGTITKPELSQTLGLKKSTCTRLIDELLANELIKESGYAHSSGGRKPVLYTINPTIFYTFGIDISRTYTKVLLMDLDSNIIDSAKLSLTTTTDSKIVLDFLVSSMSTLMRQHSLSKIDLLGIGIGAVGPLDREKGLILDPVFMPSSGWQNVNIKDFIENKLEMKVILDYGVNTALLAEYHLSSLQDYDNIAYVIKGAGSRTGLIVDGRLTHGSDKLGRLGQGHMIVDLNGKKCVCGSHGCVQAYSSMTAMIEEVTKQIKEGKKSILQHQVNVGEPLSYDAICEAINLGDELSTAVIKEAGYYAGIGLSNLMNVIHPDLMILTGPVYRSCNLFYETVKETASARNEVIYPEHRTVFSRGYLGENAVAIGAGNVVMNYYLADSAPSS